MQLNVKKRTAVPFADDVFTFCKHLCYAVSFEKLVGAIILKKQTVVPFPPDSAPKHCSKADAKLVVNYTDYTGKLHTIP